MPTKLLCAECLPAQIAGRTRRQIIRPLTVKEKPMRCYCGCDRVALFELLIPMPDDYRLEKHVESDTEIVSDKEETPYNVLAELNQRELAAKVVACEFSGINPEDISAVEEIDYDIADKALLFIQEEVDAYLKLV